MASTQEVNQLYEEVLKRSLTGDDIAVGALDVFADMTVDQVKDFLINSPEGQFVSQFETELGRGMTDDDRDFYMDIAQSGLEGVPDQNRDGVVSIDDVLLQISQSGEAKAFDNQQLIDQGFAPNATGITSQIEALAPYYQNTIPMQITGGSELLPLDQNLGFFGVDPTTQRIGLMQSKPEGLMFRSGVGGFTDVLPTQMDFGIPASFANVPVFYPTAYQDFIDTKEAEAEREQNKPQRGTYAGGTVG